jgi:transposase
MSQLGPGSSMTSWSGRPADRTRARWRAHREGAGRSAGAALHARALIQGRYHDRAKAYLARKRAEGKTQREAIRCLARKLARVVFEVLRRSTLATADALAA